jgi:uncharacterized protein YndB with AHSA1/START domain
MPITSVEKDLDQLTITIVADFAAPLVRLWDAYADPRQIERFWGPPTYPATFLRHDAAPRGRSVYKMTGPSGDEHYGCWEWTAVDAPSSFDIVDWFADETGAPNTNLPAMRASFVFETTDTGSRLTTTSRFDSLEQMEQLLAMQIMEGTTEAMTQIDNVLADLTAFAADRATEAQILSDTQVRVARVIRGSVEQVWHAHNDPALMRQWLLGPDGWTMPVCEIAYVVGQSYRYVWAPAGEDEGFGLAGELLEREEPYRAVTTETMIGMDHPPTVNELNLTSVEGGTLLSLVITYANKAARDAGLATGMTGGMEASYSRLENVLRLGVSA